MRIWPFRRKVLEDESPSPPPEHMEQVMSILSPDEVELLGGLPGQAVAGMVQGVPPTVETFRPNPLFIEFMHRVIRSAGPKDSTLQAAALQQGDGWVYIIDLRTPEGPQGHVPPEDCIGAFRVERGLIVAGSYAPNERHRVFTQSGLVCLPPGLRAAFIAQLQEVRRQSSAR